MGTHPRILSESFLMNTNMTGFRWFSKIFMFLEGLILLDASKVGAEQPSCRGKLNPYATGG